MYTLDINFLEDDSRKSQEVGTAGTISADEGKFIAIGGGIAALAIAAVGGMFLALNNAVAAQKQRIEQLTQEEQQLDAKLKELASAEQSVQQIEAETQELVKLFVGQVPLSAILTEVQERILKDVWVTNIQQAGTNVNLRGRARSYEDVNYFVVVLRESPLFASERVVLQSATQQKEDPNTGIALVDFEIQAGLTTKNTAELLPDLERLKAEGTVARIRLLQEEGVIQ
ncbi:MAG: PilN domain-containing protein [Pseudanabaenaceae cyanobacterium]